MILLQGSLPACKSCTIAKAKQRNIPKDMSGENKATEFNGRVFQNLAKIKVLEELGEIDIAKSNWHILIDKLPAFKQSAFLRQKGASFKTCVNTCTVKKIAVIQFESCIKTTQRKHGTDQDSQGQQGLNVGIRG
jgi:hypothetical protein